MNKDLKRKEQLQNYIVSGVAIVCVLMILFVQINKGYEDNHLCIINGYNYSIDPSNNKGDDDFKYIQEGYIGCARIINTCNNGLCVTSYEYGAVKK